jgi:hypothetical protein
MIVEKRIDLPLLEQELAAAAVAVNALGTFVDDQQQTNLHTYDVSGAAIDLPPEAVPVVDAHVAPPLVFDYVGKIAVDALVSTTDDTPTEIYRVPAQPNHVYAATLAFLGTDPAIAVYEASRRWLWKRLGAGAVQVGEAPITDLPEAATADWDVLMRVEGNDAVFEVIGERTGPANWLLSGEIKVFAPGGLQG